MEKVIIYGLGKQYSQRKSFYERHFEIVGYSDKKEKTIPKFINSMDIANYNFVSA